ncbi:MAG TPA: hypothetical protein GX526_01575, partial [Thermoanaerobacterales bacterium]|nr:hypothetical protein [Thermoanaerobacterales bacterium]
MELAQKLLNIMEAVKYIQKRGVNRHFGYTYATEADVAEAVREEMIKQKVVAIPSVIEDSIREIQGRKGTLFVARAKIKFTFIDIETGKSIDFIMVGEGQDVGDKAIYKAITGCQKYALMKLFLIPTGDDPELDKQEPEEEKTKITEAQLLERIKAVELGDEKYPDKNLVEIYDTNKEHVVHLSKNANDIKVKK